MVLKQILVYSHQATSPQKQMYIFCPGNPDTRRKIIAYLPANAHKIPWNLRKK
jgi:hypothetical protein